MPQYHVFLCDMRQPYAKHFHPAQAFTTKVINIRNKISAGVLNGVVLTVVTLKKQ